MATYPEVRVRFPAIIRIRAWVSRMREQCPTVLRLSVAVADKSAVASLGGPYWAHRDAVRCFSQFGSVSSNLLASLEIHRTIIGLLRTFALACVRDAALLPVLRASLLPWRRNANHISLFLRSEFTEMFYTICIWKWWRMFLGTWRTVWRCCEIQNSLFQFRKYFYKIEYFILTLLKDSHIHQTNRK
jgi:hypothetical protein